MSGTAMAWAAPLALIVATQLPWSAAAPAPAPGPGIPAPDDLLPAPAPFVAPAPLSADDVYIEMAAGVEAQCNTSLTPPNQGQIFENCGFDIRTKGGQTAACTCQPDCYGDSCCPDYSTSADVFKHTDATRAQTHTLPAPFSPCPLCCAHNQVLGLFAFCR